MRKQGNTKKVTLSPNKVTPARPKDRRKKAVKQTDPAGALRADLRRKEAVHLRLAGCTFREIGEELGISEKTAHVYVTDGWERIQAETDEARRELRDLELARINGQYRRLYPVATRNNLVVVNVALGPSGPVEVRGEDIELQIKASAECRKLSEQRAKLLGLYAPTKIEDSRPASALIPIEELKARVAEQKARQAGEAAFQGKGKSDKPGAKAG